MRRRSWMPCWQGRSSLVLFGAALGLVGLGCSPNVEDPVSTSTNASVETELAPVLRQDIVETETVQASVGFGSSWTLPIEMEGVVTEAPSVGSLLSSGDVLVEVSGRPLVLVIGESPLYRPLRLVGGNELDEAGTLLGLQRGPDVSQLQAFLIDQGFDDQGRLQVDEIFGLSTQRAARAWQASVGHPATGVIDISQMVFLTNDVVLRTDYIVGQAFVPIEVSGTATTLGFIGSTTLRDFFPLGATIDVASEADLTGVVTRSTRVASQDGDGAGQMIEITVEGVNSDDLGETVEVAGSKTSASDVLTIPVRALLALSDGRWQVEVNTANDDAELVEVELIDVIGTTAIVEGVAEGDNVVVPV